MVRGYDAAGSQCAEHCILGIIRNRSSVELLPRQAYHACCRRQQNPGADALSREECPASLLGELYRRDSDAWGANPAIYRPRGFDVGASAEALLYHGETTKDIVSLASRKTRYRS